MKLAAYGSEVMHAVRLCMHSYKAASVKKKLQAIQSR